MNMAYSKVYTKVNQLNGSEASSLNPSGTTTLKSKKFTDNGGVSVLSVK